MSQEQVSHSEWFSVFIVHISELTNTPDYLSALLFQHVDYSSQWVKDRFFLTAITPPATHRQIR
jgi:hypothetical protein